MRSPAGVHRDLVAAPLEEQHAELVLELLDRDRQRRLGNEAGVGGAAEVALARHGHDVLELGQGHASRKFLSPAEPTLDVPPGGRRIVLQHPLRDDAGFFDELGIALQVDEA